MAGLDSTRYVPPGTYIGQLIRPAVGALPTFARLPSIVGRGSRLARLRNGGVLRSFVYEETLSFTPNVPYQADTDYDSDQTQTGLVKVVDDLANVVPTNKWQWVDANTIEINPDTYDANRTYKIDYQSIDRFVLDPIPIQDIRGAVRMSLQVDQDEFEENVNFRLPHTFNGTPAGRLTATNRTNETPLLAAINATVDAGTTATFVHGGATDFTHLFSRSYVVVVTAVGGVAPNRTVDFRWSSSPISGGFASLPHNPYDPATTAEWPTFQIVENVEDNPTITLEHGVQVTIDITDPLVITVGDQWTWNALAAPLMEVDPVHTAATQYENLGTITAGENTGTGSIAFNQVSSDFTLSRATHFALECTALAGAAPNRTADFIWSRYGDSLAGVIGSGSFQINEANAVSGVVTIPAASGVGAGLNLEFQFGATNFADGDRWSWTSTPVRVNSRIKDDRTYTITVGAVVDNGGAPRLSGSWATNTPEGGFGSFTADPGGYLNTTNSTTGLPNDLRILPRNVHAAFADARYVAADVFSLGVTLDDTIDWSLTERRTEVVPDEDLLYDASGIVTGTAGTWYLILTRSPDTIVSVSANGAALAYTRLGTTAYLYFTTQPSSDVTILYEWTGGEPAPGSLYYLTSNHIRTADLYNTPQLIRNVEEAVDLLGPMASDNDLLIAAEIAFDYPVEGIYVTQVLDGDSDGIYQDADYKTAITATETQALITDRVVVNRWSTVADQLASLDRMNDPFEDKDSLGWFGAPSGTPVGDESTTGSLVHTAQKTFRVYGDSNAHGTRILHEATWCKRQITTPDGLVQTVTLDGSFVAVALASLSASFTDSASVILKRTITSFSEMEVHTEGEHITLGGAQVIWFTDEGNGVFRIEESVTVDDFAQDFTEISAMNQKKFVKVAVRSEVDKAIAVVPPNRSEGADIVLGLVINALKGLVASGQISSYLDASGNIRALDESADVIAFVDDSDSTKIRFRYTFFLRYPIKRAFGIYTVDGKAFI